MLCRTAMVALTLSFVACAEIPPAPVNGTGGSAGEGGMAGRGGLGGVGGVGGSAGAGGAGGIDPCAKVVFGRTTFLESDDNELPGGPNGNVSAVSDSVDRWSITTCGGSHDILLRWDEDGQGFDLDLLLLDSGEKVVGMGTPLGTPQDKEELTGVNLTAGEPFFVEVQAVDTTDVSSLIYNVTVAPSD